MRNGRPSPIRAWPCIHYFSHAATKWEVSKCLPQSRSSFLGSEQNHQIGISISDCVLSLSHSAEQRLCLHILQSLFVSVISSSPAAPIWSSTVYSPLNIWSFLCYFRRQNARFSQIVQKKKKKKIQILEYSFVIIFILGTYVTVAFAKWKCAFGPGDIISCHGLSSTTADAAYKMTPEGCILKLLSLLAVGKAEIFVTCHFRFISRLYLCCGGFLWS